MMHNNNRYKNYGLKGNVSLPHNTPSILFEKDMYNIVRNTEFRNVDKDFQDILKGDINEMRSSKNFFNFCRQVNKPVRNVRHRLQQTFR